MGRAMGSGTRRWGAKGWVIAGALVAAATYASWLRVRSIAAGEGDLSDGARRFAGIDDERLRYAAWDAPRLEERLASPAQKT